MKDFKALLKGENIINKDLNAKKKKKSQLARAEEWSPFDGSMSIRRGVPITGQTSALFVIWTCLEDTEDILSNLLIK